MRKTKIICTLGPSTDRDGILEQCIESGMNVARLNFSHGSHEEQQKRIDNSIGILNVQKRIKLLCGPKYGLSYMENETGGVTARLLLPHEEDAK